MSQFNSRNYEWSTVSVQIDNRLVVGLRHIAYKRTKEMEYLYTTGNEPTDIMEGNIAYEGTVTLVQDELERLIERAPGGHIDNLAGVTITVAYRKPGGALTTNILTGVRFPEMGKELRQNDKHMEVALPLMFLGLQNL